MRPSTLTQLALALAARARLHAIRGEAAQAKAKMARAAELPAQSGSERERSHVNALSFAINGKFWAAFGTTAPACIG